MEPILGTHQIVVRVQNAAVCQWSQRWCRVRAQIIYEADRQTKVQYNSSKKKGVWESKGKVGEIFALREKNVPL